MEIIGSLFLKQFLYIFYFVFLLKRRNTNFQSIWTINKILSTRLFKILNTNLYQFSERRYIKFEPNPTQTRPPYWIYKYWSQFRNVLSQIVRKQEFLSVILKTSYWIHYFWIQHFHSSYWVYTFLTTHNVIPQKPLFWI